MSQYLKVYFMLLSGLAFTRVFSSKMADLKFKGRNLKVEIYYMSDKI